MQQQRNFKTIFEMIQIVNLCTAQQTFCTIDIQTLKNLYIHTYKYIFIVYMARNKTINAEKKQKLIENNRS